MEKAFSTTSPFENDNMDPKSFCLSHSNVDGLVSSVNFMKSNRSVVVVVAEREGDPPATQDAVEIVKESGITSSPRSRL